MSQTNSEHFQKEILDFVTSHGHSHFTVKDDKIVACTDLSSCKDCFLTNNNNLSLNCDTKRSEWLNAKYTDSSKSSHSDVNYCSLCSELEKVYDGRSLYKNLLSIIHVLRSKGYNFLEIDGFLLQELRIASMNVENEESCSKPTM